MAKSKQWSTSVINLKALAIHIILVTGQFGQQQHELKVITVGKSLVDLDVVFMNQKVDFKMDSLFSGLSM